MFKKDFLRIKFDDKDDDSISHTLKAFNFINKLLESMMNVGFLMKKTRYFLENYRDLQRIYIKNI